MQIVDFNTALIRAKARANALALKFEQPIDGVFYVEFTNAELQPAANRATVADLLREGVAVLGFEATVQEIEL